MRDLNKLLENVDENYERVAIVEYGDCKSSYIVKVIEVDKSGYFTGKVLKKFISSDDYELFGHLAICNYIYGTSSYYCSDYTTIRKGIVSHGNIHDLTKYGFSKLTTTKEKWQEEYGDWL